MRFCDLSLALLLSPSITTTAVVIYDDGGQHTIDTRINDFVEVGQDTTVTVAFGGHIEPPVDGLDQAALTVGRLTSTGAQVIVQEGAIVTAPTEMTVVGTPTGPDAIKVNPSNSLFVEGGTITGGDAMTFGGNAVAVIGPESYVTITGGTFLPGRGAQSAEGYPVLAKTSAVVTIGGGNFGESPGDRCLGTDGDGLSEIFVTGGNCIDDGYWFILGDARVQVDGECLRYDANCGESVCPLTGVLADGSPISVQVQLASGNSVDVMGTCPPTSTPTVQPTASPTGAPSTAPSVFPSTRPSPSPTGAPSLNPTSYPSEPLSTAPSPHPSAGPTSTPTLSAQPSFAPSDGPSSSSKPSYGPSPLPTFLPSAAPSFMPTSSPSLSPSSQPTFVPTSSPSLSPSSQPIGNASTSRALKRFSVMDQFLVVILTCFSTLYFLRPAV